MSGEKNIVVYSEYFYPMFCGVPMSSRNIARSLSELGHRVAVYTPMGRGDYQELEEGYSVVRGRDWRNLHKFGQVDIVIINNGNFSTKGFLLGCWLNARIVQWFQMTYVPRVELTLKGFINELVEKLTCRFISAFVGVSSLALTSRPWLPRRKPRRVIFNCGEALFSELPIPQRPREYDFIFVGRMTKAKGMHVLSKALDLLDKDEVDAKLLMVGDGELRCELEKHASKYKTLKVTYAGVQRGTDLVACYDNARAFLFPTTTHPEGLPLVLSEAVMRRLPIISSDHPVALEAVSGYAQIYSRESAEELANVMKNSVTILRSGLSSQKESQTIRDRFSFPTLKQQIQELVLSVALINRHD